MSETRLVCEAPKVGSSLLSSWTVNQRSNVKNCATARADNHKKRQIRCGKEQYMSFTLPELPYSHDALEPYIDKTTMAIHHEKHHGTYVTNLNKALESTEWKNRSLEEILAKVSKLPMAVRNNGGGHWNHSAFWKWMRPKGSASPSGELANSITKDFGSFDKFKEQFSNAAATRFGSGWAWLIDQHGKLVVASTPNQDNPLMDVAETKGIPILGLDV